MERNEEASAVSLNAAVRGTLNWLVGVLHKELICRGIIFLLFGLLLLFRPGQTLLAVTIAVGVIVIADGIALLISALFYRGDGKIFQVLNASFFILLGIFTCANPLVMNLTWVTLLGFWQFFSGIQCFGFRSSAGKSAVISGICGVIAGLFLILLPFCGMITLTWLMGIISFVSGLSALLLGIRLKRALK